MILKVFILEELQAQILEVFILKGIVNSGVVSSEWGEKDSGGRPPPL
jgi:hypothetical protein